MYEIFPAVKNMYGIAKRMGDIPHTVNSKSYWPKEQAEKIAEELNRQDKTAQEFYGKLPSA